MKTDIKTALPGFLRALIVLLAFNAPTLLSTVSATNYYVSATGSDKADGLSPSTPWQTISKVNSIFTYLQAGSSILFNRGDTFYGTLTIGKSGASGSPITIGAYGAGAKPVITGFTTITSGWTNEGGGIYSKVIASTSLTNMVTLDGKQVGMGRYPDSGFLTFEAATDKSITDNGLGSATNWTGAEIVIRKNDWTMDRCHVDNHSGDVLTYSNFGSNQTPTAGFGYFFMNDLKTLTTYGEWYHNVGTGKFYMYFGSVDPNSKVVQVATLEDLIQNKVGFDYIVMDNLNMKGAINDAVDYTAQSDFCTVQNCDISYCGDVGVVLGTGTDFTVDNNTISFCNSHAAFSSSSLSKITNNIVSDIGLIVGQSYYRSGIDGFWLMGYGGVISYNTIKRIGYNGIGLRYKGAATISYNYIDQFAWC
jgi:parallel beta-helix repeat protein